MNNIFLFFFYKSKLGGFCKKKNGHVCRCPKGMYHAVVFKISHYLMLVCYNISNISFHCLIRSCHLVLLTHMLLHSVSFWNKWIKCYTKLQLSWLSRVFQQVQGDGLLRTPIRPDVLFPTEHLSPNYFGLRFLYPDLLTTPRTHGEDRSSNLSDRQLFQYSNSDTIFHCLK